MSVLFSRVVKYLDFMTLGLVSKIDFGYENNACFLNMDENEEWKIAEESEEQTYFNLEYSFVKYVRK